MGVLFNVGLHGGAVTASATHPSAAASVSAIIRSHSRARSAGAVAAHGPAPAATAAEPGPLVMDGQVMDQPQAGPAPWEHRAPQRGL